jgi:hypothetical protein
MKYTEEQIKRMEERLASYMADDRSVVNFSITGSLGDHMEDWTMPVTLSRTSFGIYLTELLKYTHEGHEVLMPGIVLVKFSTPAEGVKHIMELLDRWPKCEDDYMTRMRHIIGGACR